MFRKNIILKSLYLKLLGLSESASIEDIKKAYRKKSKRYHPDINSSPKSKDTFILINKAYNFLIENYNTENKLITDENSSFFIKKYNKYFTKKELEEHLIKVKKNIKLKEEKEYNILNISYNELKKSTLFKISNTLSILSIFFALFITIDFFILSPKKEVGVAFFFDNYYNGQKVIVQLKDKSFITIGTSIKDKNFDVIRKNYVIEYLTSPIFKEVYKLKNINNKQRNYMTNQLSFFRLIYLLLVIFTAPIFNFIFKGPNSFYIIFVHLSISLPIFGWFILLSF